MTTAGRGNHKLARLTEWTGPSCRLVSTRIPQATGADPSTAVLDDFGDPAEVRIDGCLASDDQTDRLPGERINLFEYITQSRDPRDGSILLTKRATFDAGGAFVVGERVVTTSGLWRESVALSWMARSPHDVRPHLLLLCFGQVAESLAPCLAYGANYMRAWAKPRLHRACEDAALDGLLNVYWGRDTRGSTDWSRRPTIKERSLKHRMAPRDYATLRRHAVCVFEMRLSEAIEQFEKVGQLHLERLAPSKRYLESRENNRAVPRFSLARLAA